MTTDRREDIANREFYNHLPTRHVTVTYECDVACDPNAPSGGEDKYVWSLLHTDVVPGNLRVRNPRLVSADVGDEVRYLDSLGNETQQSPTAERGA
jgi:hypothetical protein